MKFQLELTSMLDFSNEEEVASYLITVIADKALHRKAIKQLLNGESVSIKESANGRTIETHIILRTLLQ